MLKSSSNVQIDKCIGGPTRSDICWHGEHMGSGGEWDSRDLIPALE